MSDTPDPRAAPLARWLWPLGVVLLTLPAIWPFLRTGGYWSSHDGLFHLYRLLSLEEAWARGVWYPRIFPDFAFGYGFAVLNFYGPLTYYLALALRGAGMSSVLAMKLTFALSYPLAALAMWWYVRDLWRREARAGDLAGLFAAAVYTYIPYHMADVQLRGALAESWAFVWWPLLFWATWRVRLWPLAFSLAALVLTHNLSVVLAGVALVAWGLLAWWAHRRDRTWVGNDQNDLLAGSGPVPNGWQSARPLALLALAVGIALAMSAFYWLPVALESRYVFISQDVGGLGYERHLASWNAWIAPSADYRYMPNQGVAADHPLSWAQVALLVLAFCGLPLAWRDRVRGPLLFWWGVLLVTLFLLTPSSSPFWRALVFPLGLVQYPWRWLGLTSVATAVTVSFLFSSRAVMSSGVRTALRGAAALLLGWLALSTMQYLPWEGLWVDTARHPEQMWIGDAAAGQVGATWTAEFLPLTVREQRWALARAPEAILNPGEQTPLRLVAASTDGFTFSAVVEAGEAAMLLFPRFAYPSMRATVNGVSRPVEARGIMGLAAVEIEPGRHDVRLEAFPLASRPWLEGALWLLFVLVALFALWQWLGRWMGIPVVLAALVVVLALRPASTQAEPLTRPLPGGEPAQLGEQVQLVASRYRSARPGASLHVTLLWFNLLQSDRPYTTFVHLTPQGGGAPVAQHDAEPNLGTVPVPRWLPGQLVEDLHLLEIPVELPPGVYELWAGMYGVVDGQATPVPGDSGERRLLGTVEVR